MTREEIKRHLDRKPLVWQWSKDVTDQIFYYDAGIDLIESDGDECGLHIDFGICIDEVRCACYLSLSVHGEREAGAYDLVNSSGYIVPLEDLKAKAEERLLMIVCRLLGVTE